MISFGRNLGVQVKEGRVLHVYSCECEDGMVVVCLKHPGSNCPCSGTHIDCPACQGEMFLYDPDCNCSLCEQVAEDWEKTGHA